MPIPTDDLANRAPDERTGNFATDLALAAKDAYCQVYRSDPLSVRQWGVSNPVSAAIAALNESLCRRTPPAPGGVIQVPLTGGQCSTLYRVENIWSGNFDPGFGQQLTPTNGTSGSNLLGPIASVSTSIIESGVAGNPFQSQITVTNSAGASQELRSGPSATRPTGRFNLIRLDNNPDSCGDPVPSPEPVPPPFPDPPVKYVPVPVPGPFGGVYVVPVILKPIITLAPEINIQAGPFNISFGPFDTTISPNFYFDDDYVPPPIPLPDPVPQPRPLPPGGRDNPNPPAKCPDIDLSPVITRLDNLSEDVDEGFDGVNEKLDELLDCDRCDKEYTEETQVIGNGQSGQGTLPANTYKVRLVIQSVPSTERMQFVVNAPNILYIGTAAFGDSNGYSSRQPVSFQLSTYFAPEKATKFMWALHNNVTAVAIAHYLVEEEE